MSITAALRQKHQCRQILRALSQWTTRGSRLDWATGDEPMTGAQASYLETLSREAGEEAPPADLTKAQASERIDALQQQTGWGA